MDQLIAALASKADAGTIVAFLVAVGLWVQNNKLNEARTKDAENFAEALTQSAKITAEAINQSTAAINRMTDHMISKGGK